MSRSRKLLIVALVVVVGCGLAWPFRKTIADKETDPKANSTAMELPQAKGANAAPLARQPIRIGTPTPHVTAKMASTAEAEHSTDRRAQASFDLANHPALTASRGATPLPPELSPVTPAVPPKVQAPPVDYRPAQVQKYPGDARPAYSTVESARAAHAREERPEEVRHVVQNSDTLEKLAKRYLGSEERALEIFDLNRDVLDNPHLLPIDAELRIPPDARKRGDE